MNHRARLAEPSHSCASRVHQLANELGARTRRGAPLAVLRVSRVIKLVDSLRVYRDHVAPARAAYDAVVFDRYVETHIAAALDHCAAEHGWPDSAIG